MGNNLAKLFGIEQEEKGLITTLLIQSVFLGIFYGVFNITAHSLFLAKFDETIMARAYILSGLVGSGLTYLYTVLQSRMRFLGFSVLNLLFILILTLGLWILMAMRPADWVIFGIFIMLGPLNLLALLGFYGTTGRLFTLRQGKRLFGIIDTGLVVGVILSSFAIPALLSMNMQTRDILLISAISILAAVIVQGVIGRNYNDIIKKATSGGEVKAGLSLFRKDRYIRTMGFFIAFSMVVMFFVQYSFMAVTRERFPEEQEMANFLGLFEGSMMVFTLLIKTFIFSYLIKNQGLKTTLAVAPVLIAIFTLVVVVIGTTRGFTPEASGFMLFFLILAISRLFSKAMKDSVETPAFKVLYQTLDEKIRYGVQSAIDGTVNEIAALTSGLILSGLGALMFVKLIHFSWVLFAILVAWVFLAIRLYSEYRRSVQKSLESIDTSEAESAGTQFESTSTRAGIALEIQNNYFSIINANGYLDKIRSNNMFIEAIINKAEDTLNPDMIPLLKSISKFTVTGDLQKRIDTLIVILESKISEIIACDVNKLADYMGSAEDRRRVVRALYASGKQPVITDLLRLIRDQDAGIKRETIFLIGRLGIRDLLPEVCDCLDNPDISADAYSVLRSFGTEAFDALSAYFFRSTERTDVRRLIIRLFGETGSKDAIDFLLPRLWSVRKSLRKEAVTGLLNCGCIPTQEINDRISQDIQDVIGLITWNISAGLTLKQNEDKVLGSVLKEETQWWYEFLFDLLSLAYDKASFDKIRENLASETVESVNFALEMIDIVVDDAIKPRLTSLLDVVSDEEKIKNLFQFYPGNIPIYSGLVEDLVNKDYNHISIWTKVCALRSLYNIDRPENIDFIIALLFSPDIILREEGVRFIREHYNEVFEKVAYRLPAKYRPHLDEILAGEIPDKNEIFNKIEFLVHRFPGIPENSLISLAADMIFINKPDELKSQYLDNDFIAWSASEAKEEKVSFFNWSDLDKKFDSKSAYPRIEYPIYILRTRTLAQLIYHEPKFISNILVTLEQT
ncbi:MAG TPA: hypothetical protein VMW76_01830 [Bacteroidales bacterium]|nr:hypothetical protein [Bacteroidales bacterium]